MKIKKLKLNNIRSYTSCEIVFPDGISLLSGNVGSGKSSILLAIEFALFGIQRGEISGSSLLRTGCDSGFVNLFFEINNKEICVKITLKRSNNGIVQDSGFFTIDDITQSLTSGEIKQKILELFNYPQESLSKKSSIYRYTIYTPQENMKLILSGDKDIRLETLRRVFNMDKYKRISNNCKILLIELRSRKREFAASIADLEPKKEKLNELNIKILESKSRINNISEMINSFVSDMKLKKDNLDIIEKEIVMFNERKREFDILRSHFSLKSELKNKSILNIEELQKQISPVNENIDFDKVLESLKSDLLLKTEIILNLEKSMRDNIRALSEFKIKKQNSENIKNKIIAIDLCPLCEQSVKHEHKEGIIKREEEILVNSAKSINELLKNEKDIELQIKNIKNEIEIIRSKQKEIEILKSKHNDMRFKKEQLSRLNNEQRILSEELETLSNRIALLESEILKLKDIELKYKESKLEYDGVVEKHRNLDIEKASSYSELKILESQHEDLTKEISLKEKTRLKLQKYIELQDWIESFFMNLMGVIEKKVMFKIHNEFNLLFQNWFSMFMDSENMRVRLDEEFTPLIEQNGYDLDYDSLSGGERTACALAYRLSLNQVINTIADFINTRDLIILDEPTEGFSSEQIEKMRDVLRELNMKQIIIVSHESKIESFVDSTIYIKKENS